MKVGIVGCGQLARMLAHAAARLGIDTCFIAEAGESTRCVEGLGPVAEHRQERPVRELYEALGRPDVITVEREHVDVELLQALEHCCPVRPNPAAVANTGNRLREKRALVDLGLPVAPFRAVRDRAGLDQALSALGYPAFLKGCEQGYDGKNQWRLDGPADLASVHDNFPDQSCVLEAGINYTAEVSLIGARGVDGETGFFPLTENHHRDGILLASFAPAPRSLAAIEQAGRRYLKEILDAWQYVGVLTVEMFVTGQGAIINELAPRVHNSGHWTLDGCSISQFEQHLRAITGLALAPAEPRGVSAMVNLLGSEGDPAARDHPAAVVHLYNKTPRPGRKVGHVNFNDTEQVKVRAGAGSLIEKLYPESLHRNPAHAVTQ